MNRWKKMIGMSVLTLAAGTAGVQAEQPFTEQLIVHEDRPNTARVIVHANLHPEVAVSRSLAAQPVHPYMVEVLLNEAISTWIDPLAKLDGESGLIEGHSLLRAQQLGRDLRGISSLELAAVQARASIAQPVATNTARVLTTPHRTATALPQPRMIIDMRPAPANEKSQPRPIPSVPKPAVKPDHQLAAAQK